MDAVVVLDGAEHLIVSSPKGIYEIGRIGSNHNGDRPVLTSVEAGAMAVGRNADGSRVVVAHVGDAVRVLEADGTSRDVPLLAGRADVRALVIDGAGRIIAVRETVLDTLEAGADSFMRNAIVGTMRASSAVAAADGDGIFVVGDEGEHGVVVRVTKNGQQSFATTETGIRRAWASRSALWGIDRDERLYRIDLATRAIRVERPDVGRLGAISGIETVKSDLVVVVGDVSALYDGKRFEYPGGSTLLATSVAVDADSSAAYIGGPFEPRMIPLTHPWLVSSRRMFSTSLGFGPERGPIHPKPSEPKRIDLPSLRLGYGYGWNGAYDSSEFDAAFGLRIGFHASDEPHFFFWPEVGYSSSSRGHFVTLGPALHWGNIYASTGPAVRGLLGAEANGEIASGIRSTWNAGFFAGLLDFELGHQLMFVPGGPRHEGRALASVDLLTGGGLLLYLGVPLGVLTGILITEALR